MKNRVAWVALGASLLAVAVSFFAEFFLGEKPCSMCYYQRWTYQAVFGVAGLSLFLPNRLLRWGIPCLFFAAAGFGLYHYLIQTGVVLDPCAVPAIATIDDFKTMLDKPAGCSKIGLTVFGLPASLVSCVYASSVGLITTGH